MIYVTPDPSSAMLIRRGRRMADYLGAECFAVGVLAPRGDHRPDERVDAVETHLNFARNLHIEARILEGNDPAETIVDFARRNRITQILLSRPKHRSWGILLGTDLIPRIVRKAKDIRVIVLAERRRQHQPVRHLRPTFLGSQITSRTTKCGSYSVLTPFMRFLGRVYASLIR